MLSEIAKGKIHQAESGFIPEVNHRNPGIPQP